MISRNRKYMYSNVVVPSQMKGSIAEGKYCTGIDIMLSNLTKTAIQRLVH